MFNSRTCQLVLGAGALQLVGLKTITAKHLGSLSVLSSTQVKANEDRRDIIKRKLRYYVPMSTLKQLYYLTIRPVARKGYGSIAHEAKPNGLLIRGP